MIPLHSSATLECHPFQWCLCAPVKPNTFIFHGECHGSLLGTPNLTTAHLIPSHLIAVVAHLVASTIPQVADFTNGCPNLWSNKEKELYCGCIPISSSNWQLSKTYGNHISKGALLFQAFRMESETQISVSEISSVFKYVSIPNFSAGNSYQIRLPAKPRFFILSHGISILDY